MQRCRELELLGADDSNGVDLYSSDGSASRVDMPPVVSSYQDHSTGERFHLHPELVDKSGDASTVLLCHHCDNTSMPPRMSIANNIDFGLLSRIDFYFGPSFCASHFIIARCACRTAAMGTSLDVRAE